MSEMGSAEMRSSNTQLPTSKELVSILEGESQRKAVRFDFLLRNPGLFLTYRRVAQGVDASMDWLDHYADLTLEEVVNGAHRTTNTLTEIVLRKEIEKGLLDELFSRLAVNERPSRSDAIFVFGSPKDIRVARAVELYHQNIAPLIILSGRGPHYEAGEETEAERMAEYALKNGVPASALIVEPGSITLPDNVKRTLDLFEENNFRPQKICVVVTSYIMRRALMEWYKFTPWEIETVAVDTVGASEQLQQTGWYRTEQGVRMLLNEYAKIILEHKMDLVRKNT